MRLKSAFRPAYLAGLVRTNTYNACSTIIRDSYSSVALKLARPSSAAEPSYKARP